MKQSMSAYFAILMFVGFFFAGSTLCLAQETEESAELEGGVETEEPQEL